MRIHENMSVCVCMYVCIHVYIYIYQIGDMNICAYKYECEHGQLEFGIHVKGSISIHTQRCVQCLVLSWAERLRQFKLQERHVLPEPSCVCVCILVLRRYDKREKEHLDAFGGGLSKHGNLDIRWFMLIFLLLVWGRRTAASKLSGLYCMALWRSAFGLAGWKPEVSRIREPNTLPHTQTRTK